MRLLVTIQFALLAVGAHAAQPAPDPDHTILVMLRTSPDHYRPGNAYGGGYGDTAGRATLSRIAGGLARHHHLRLLGDWPMPALGIDCFIMALPEGRKPADAAEELSREERVAWAQPLQRYRAQGAALIAGARDPLFRAQPAASLWRLDELHRHGTGRGVTVAIVDSRIDEAHPDLVGQMIVSRDFAEGHGLAPERHGTGVAGVIAAREGNGIGVAGVAPGVRLLGLRACWEDTGADGTICDTLSLAKALHFAIEHRAQVINLSLTGPSDVLLARLIEVGLGEGATVVAAADTARSDGGFPASQPGVIAVADHTVARAANPVYVAPGRDIPTTAPGGKWVLVNGSSFSAAHVSGLMALAREHGARREARPVRTVDGAVDACRTVGCTPRLRDGACLAPCGRAAAR